MNFDEWLNEEIAKLRRISVRLREEFGSVDRDYQEWLFMDAREPWGFARNRQPDRNSGTGGNASHSRQDQAQSAHPISAKQKATIERHLQGKLGSQIAILIAKTGKPLDRLSSSEASDIISLIFKGGGR